MDCNPPCELTTYRSREEWLAARRSLVTASDATVLFRMYSSPFALWQDKKSPALIDYQTQRQRMGLLMENVVLEEVQACHGGQVHRLDEHTIATNRDHPFMSATPDALYESSERDGLGNLQIKTWSEFDRKAWADDPPLAVQAQVQAEIFALGLQWSAIGVAFGCSEVGLYFVDRNERFLEAWLHLATEFYESLAADEPPGLDDTEATRRAIERLHPSDNGDIVALPDDAETLLDSLAKLTALESKIKNRKTAVSNQLRAMLGDATYGISAGGRCVSWKTQRRKEYTVAESEFRVLRQVKRLPKGAALPEPVDYQEAERKRLPAALKQRLLEADGRCRWCGAQLTRRTATFEHLAPLSQGGTNREENIALACASCNQERGDDATQ